MTKQKLTNLENSTQGLQFPLKTSRTAEMVLEALKNLKERNGTTFKSIKDYVTSNNKDINIYNYVSSMHKFIKNAILNGVLEKTFEGRLKIASTKMSNNFKKVDSVTKPLEIKLKRVPGKVMPQLRPVPIEKKEVETAHSKSSKKKNISEKNTKTSGKNKSQSKAGKSKSKMAKKSNKKVENSAKKKNKK